MSIGEEGRAKIERAWPDILARIAAGELIKTLLVEHGLSNTSMRAYVQEGGSARRAQWDDAREASADAFYDEALEVARTPNTTQVEASDARTRIDTLKWAARIRNPRAYQDQSKLDVNVRTVDLTAIISAANARLLASQAERLVTGERVVDRLPELSELL